MRYSKIYFDLDGVLADFFGGVRELADYPLESENSDFRDDGLWAAVNAVPHFNMKLKPNPGALEMFFELSSRYPGACEVLSAVPGAGSFECGWVEVDKRFWCAKHLGDDVPVNIVVSGSGKLDFCTGKDCVLIDDSKRNVEAWRKRGGVGILYSSADEVMRFFDETSE